IRPFRTSVVPPDADRRRNPAQPRGIDAQARPVHAVGAAIPAETARQVRAKLAVLIAIELGWGGSDRRRRLPLAARKPAPPRGEDGRSPRWKRRLDPAGVRAASSSRRSRSRRRRPSGRRPCGRPREGPMAESVYKVVELVGTSTESWEKAAKA